MIGLMGIRMQAAIIEHEPLAAQDIQIIPTMIHMHTVAKIPVTGRSDGATLKALQTTRGAPVIY